MTAAEAQHHAAADDPPAPPAGPGRGNAAAPWAVLIALLLLLVTIQAFQAWMNWQRTTRTVHAGALQAGELSSVTLANGQVYYGEFVEAGAGHLRLANVYYVQTATDPTTKQPNNRLVSRRKADWHAPLWMSIPLDKVLMLEAVGADSRLAQLMAQDKD